MPEPGFSGGFAGFDLVHPASQSADDTRTNALA